MTEYSLLNEEAHSYIGDAYLSSQPRPLYFPLGKSPEGVLLYSTAIDPQPQMIPRPQMIPKMDRKWSSTASDPESRPQMIPWKLEEWNGFYGTDYKKGLIIKKKPFSLAF